METSTYTVEVSFIDRSKGTTITEHPVRLSAGAPLPAVNDSVYLTEKDTDYSSWIVKSREFMYLMHQPERDILNLRVTLQCDRQT